MNVSRSGPSTISSLRDYPHRTIALVYDFDSTLSPQSMQEYTVFPLLGIDPSQFWAEVKAEAKKNEATEVLTYMRMMQKLICNGDPPITKERIRELGANIPFFPGVLLWFDRIDEYVRERTMNYVSVRHYVVTSGLREIVIGSAIAKHMHNIFGSQYHWNQFGMPDGIDRVITDVSKTQYLFRINKGVEDLARSVNEHMSENDRPIPFSNILYFGDGDTDVPSMTVTRKNGGHSIAVYDKGNEKSLAKCSELYRANRIDFYSDADYSHNSRLWLYTRTIIDKMLANIRLNAARYAFEKTVLNGDR